MVEKLFHCEICRSKILESRLKKHHAKVHSDIVDDIYTPLSDVASEMSPKANAKAMDSKPTSVRSASGIEPPKDEGKVHVQCGVCRNKMPAADLDAHMKRKHTEPIDQVDAIGTMVDVMLLDAVGKHISVDGLKTPNPFRKQVMPGQPLANNNDDRDKASAAVKMEPNKDPIDLRQNFKPPTTFAQNIKPTVDFGASKEAIFYTIRVNEAQMQELMNNNRIFPKNGAFYLK